MGTDSVDGRLGIGGKKSRGDPGSPQTVNSRNTVFLQQLLDHRAILGEGLPSGHGPLVNQVVSRFPVLTWTRQRNRVFYHIALMFIRG